MRKKLIILFMVLITLFNTFLPITNAFSIDKANLKKDHDINTHIQYYNESMKKWRDIQCGYINYELEGKKYPAYCIVPNVHGVDEEGPYTVTIKDLLKDKLIYNTIINGYPYKTPEELGVATKDDAYVATKHAIKSVLLNRNVKSFYKGVDTRGKNIVNAIYSIAENGKKGTELNQDAYLQINKVNNLVESGNYYYQEYSVNATASIAKYNIKNLQGFPSGTYITDVNGNKKDEFAGYEKFRVNIPKSSLNNDLLGTVKVVASCNTNPVFYGEAPNGDVQNYAVAYKPYAEYETISTLKEITNTASIKVLKKDEESLKPIEDVYFELYNEHGTLVSSEKTNSDGVAIFNNLYQGKYTIKEIKANDNYVLDDMKYEVEAKFNKQIEKVITNKHKKGNLKIIKVDKDNHNVKLDSVEFDLLDSNKEIVAHIVTDSNGEAIVENINIGNYTLKETKTKNEYNLSIDNDVVVKWNETSEVVVENEKKKGKIKIIKVDQDNKEIKLEGVEFKIIDKENNVVETIKTDKNGEALSSNLPIGEYKIKETSLGTNNEYILNNSEYTIKVEDEKITNIEIENLHKKGNLKIIKVDKDDHNITLGAIEFDLIDIYGNIVAHLITDVNGEAYIENIKTGTYTLKETKTKREYDLCVDENIVVKWNETSEIVIENEKKKGRIKVVKQDKEHNEIKLAGVKFQVINNNNRIIEEIETDSNGEAITSKLPIGEYKLREISLGNNTEYILDDNEYTVKIEDAQVSKINIYNEHKKGKIKICKVDKDNNKLPLEGVKFELIDEDGYKYKAVTDKNGVAELDSIRTGKVTIREVETKQEYVLSKEVYEIEIKYNKYSYITIDNEKRKGQVEVYKLDKDNNQIKIPNVEFDILDANNNIVDKMITDENGYAISKKLPIGEYYLRESKTNSKYVLNNESINIKIEENKVTKLNIENEKIKGRIQIIKSSSKDSPLFNIKKGEYLADVTFEIYNEDGNLVDTIITDENGQALSKELEMGRYKIVEKSTNQNYLINTNEFFVNIEKNNETIVLNVENEPIIPNVNIEKVGQQYAERNEEIRYDFIIENKGNSKLDNFTWKEYVPYEKVKLTKMVTGIYNEDINYNIYYKTNKSDYKLLSKANACKSEYINLDNIDLQNNERIIEIKVEYGTVPSNFKSIINPTIYAKVNDNVKKDDKIVNTTEIFGNIGDYIVKDSSIFETIIKENKILKKLPKTGC